MTILVVNHEHDPPLALEGTQHLIIQTGTIVFDFQGAAEGGWLRDRMVHPVLELPAAESLASQQVRAIASAAPSSIVYLPGPATDSISEEPA